MTALGFLRVFWGLSHFDFDIDPDLLGDLSVEAVILRRPLRRLCWDVGSLIERLGFVPSDTLKVPGPSLASAIATPTDPNASSVSRTSCCILSEHFSSSMF